MRPVSAARQEVHPAGQRRPAHHHGRRDPLPGRSARRPERHPEKRLRHHRAAGAFDQRDDPLSAGDRLHRHRAGPIGGRGAGAGGCGAAPENLRRLSTTPSIVIQAAGVEVPGRPRPHPPGGLQGAGVQGARTGPWHRWGCSPSSDVVIRPEMLEAALAARLKGDALAGALEIVRRVEPGDGDHGVNRA
ncbi:MAG: hypothetical protein MZV70_15190 [Desulfobacterales bacterium]|nr:hypothetical protein [Desulfobacterales bacterium]